MLFMLSMSASASTMYSAFLEIVGKSLIIVVIAIAISLGKLATNFYKDKKPKLLESGIGRAFVNTVGVMFNAWRWFKSQNVIVAVAIIIGVIYLIAWMCS